MATTFFNLKELQDTALKFAKDHPFGALLAVAVITGVGKGIADGIAKLGPHIENVGKYAVDKAVAHLPKPATQAILTDDTVVDTNTHCQQPEAVAA